jgi:hypothetical protein
LVLEGCRFKFTKIEVENVRTNKKQLGRRYVRFGVFIAVTMNNVVFSNI